MLAAGKYGAWMTLRELGRLRAMGDLHLGAVAALAQSKLRRVRAGKAACDWRTSSGRRTLCGLGIPVDATASDKIARPHKVRRERQDAEFGVREACLLSQAGSRFTCRR